MRSSLARLSLASTLAIPLLTLSGCAPSDGDGGGSDCRQEANACADGFTCVEADGDWSCRRSCTSNGECADDELCDPEQGGCVPSDGCQAVCNHVRDGRVGLDECGYGDIVFDPVLEQEAEERGEQRIDNTDIDPRDDQMPQRAYFATKSDYEVATRCE